MNREIGYYWVNHDGSWVIAYCYGGDEWEYDGRTLWTGYFDEIDETMIKRNN